MLNVKTSEEITAQEVLDKIVDYLKRVDPVLSIQNDDGRVNSASNEKEIYTELHRYSLSNEWFYEQKKLRLEKPRAREWFDFSVEQQDLGFFIPVNIKVSECIHADNLNCKLGIYYAVTGLFPKFNNSIQWETFFKELSENINTLKDKDYYFLIINKHDKRLSFWTSLKKIKDIVPNGNNLPFQCTWVKNQEQVERTHEESVKYILTKFGESIKQRASIAKAFSYYFPHYCDGGDR